jgi:sugar phosphate permease
MAMCCAGSFLMGSANIMLASCVFIRAGMSVDTLSVGMAISLVSCAQNLGQFCSPFVINLLAANINQGDINFTAFLCAGVIAVVPAVLTLKKGSEGA